MKTCISCNQPKPETEFYAHPQMKDGLLGKCKECCKSESRINNQTIAKKKYEQRRARLPHRVEARKKYQQENKVLVNEIKKRWAERNPEKIKAHRKVQDALRSFRLFKQPCWCGETKVQAHHEDYSKPLEVTWLCPKHHKEADKKRNAKA